MEVYLFTKTVVFCVLLHRIGDKVPFAKKGKFGVVHGSIQQWFNPYHLFVETNSPEDFQTDKIIQQVIVILCLSYDNV